ncbi:hypothetical protein H4S01_002695, partial [Coemansia sp. RSA 2610]
MPSDVPRPKRTPEVVVFQQPGLAPRPQNDKFEYKAFMSSKVTKIDAKRPKPKTKAEQKEEDENRQHDRQLKELLEGKLMIEKLHESQLTGKERHKHNTEKLKRLGMKVKTKEKMPADMYFAVQRNRAERTKKAVQDAQDRGVLTAAVKRELEATYMGKQMAGDSGKKRFKSDSRGLPNAGPGKFKDGVLHISKSHIDRVSGAKHSARVGKQPRGKGGKK